MKDNTLDSCSSQLGLFFLLFLSAFVGIVTKGWVLSVIWSWFIVPVTGLPLLSIPMAIGFSVAVGLITQQSQKIDTEKKELLVSIAEIIGYGVLAPLFTLGFAWIIYQFV